MTLDGKNPNKVRAGQAAMRARWGERRIVRLDELTDPQRRLVLALVDAAKTEMTKTPTVNESSVGVEPEGHGNDRPAA